MKISEKDVISLLVVLMDSLRVPSACDSFSMDRDNRHQLLNAIISNQHNEILCANYNTVNKNVGSGSVFFAENISDYTVDAKK